MAAKNERHVVPGRDGGWDVVTPGGGRENRPTQSEAISQARGDLRGGGGEVVIHRRDGRIRDSDTVKPGNDPNPPRDRR